MERAVVLGGGIAGLLAARVAAGHAGGVVVVERDDLSLGMQARRGVPQGRQLHGLLGRGLGEMEVLFPGITSEMVEAGAVAADPGLDLHWFVDGACKPAVEVGRGIACSRPFLEWHLRRRLQASANVRLVQGRVEGLVASADRSRVTGVAVSGPDATVAHLDADVVVDCTGRSSRIDAWLTDLGFEPPPQRRIDVDLGYATRLFRRREGERLDGALGVISLTKDVGRARGAAVFAVEGPCWMATVGGYQHDRPTADPADFAARLADEPAGVLGRFGGRAEPVSEVATHRYPASVRRDFDRMPRLPAGLAAAGDSVASFNPIYGQGMTSAALHAATLAAHLASGADPAGSAAGYFERLRPVIDAVWRISATEDFRLGHVTGARPRGVWVAHRVSDLYTRATLRDADLHGLFLRVLNLQVDPGALLRPAVLVRAVCAARRPLPPGDGRAGAQIAR